MKIENRNDYMTLITHTKSPLGDRGKVTAPSALCIRCSNFFSQVLM